jgi:hypothetical protein
MALGVVGSGVALSGENPKKVLDGGLIIHTAADFALKTFTPATAELYDSALVTNYSNVPVRITATAASMLGGKVYLVLPGQAVSVGFDGADPISAIASEPVALGVAAGAFEVSALAAVTALGETIYVSIVLDEK